MKLPPLQAIVDVDLAKGAGWRPTDLARAFLDGGARALQIRAKTLASGPLLDLCDTVVGAARPYAALVIVNDRADIARLSGADGVHLGQHDLAPVDARQLLGSQAIVGLSTHAVSQIEAALTEPVSYIAVGPVFGSTTKDTGYNTVGLELVSRAARLAGPTPVVAIGGITLHNAASVIDAGAASVAVIGDLLVTKDVSGRIDAYLQHLTKYLRV